MDILNTLSPLQWLGLALIFPALIALYFLKLKREPLAVPSTYLWSRAIEDMHVNSLWQRLRQSLLLFLQLLVLLLIVLTLLRPGYKGTEIQGKRFIFLIDTSAGMAATDLQPSRLEDAKKRAQEMIDKLEAEEAADGPPAAMVISFSDNARVEQPFTTNKRLLRTKIAAIAQTNRPSDMTEALRTASGLANPGQSGDKENPIDVRVADPMPAKMFILSDGAVNQVPDFKLGNLTPEYVSIASEQANNIGITAFSTSRNPDKEGKLFAFARLENSGAENKKVTASLYHETNLIDAQEAVVPARDSDGPGSAGLQFELENAEEGALRLEIDALDNLGLDNQAFAVIDYSRRAKVLLVTPGNHALQLALTTEEAAKISDVSVAAPEILETKGYAEQALDGTFDFIIYDQCTPKTMPQANTLFVGRVPPAEGWAAEEKRSGVVRDEQTIGIAVVDVEKTHPLSQSMSLDNVDIAECTPLKPPKGAVVLIDANVGPLYAVAPRGGFVDAVLGFELVGVDGTKTEANTNWSLRQSFPVFVQNAIKFLGGVGAAGTIANIKPGQTAVLRATGAVPEITVRTPSGKNFKIPREVQNTFAFTHTDEPGLYEIYEGGAKPTQRFAVNLFDGRESDLKPGEVVFIGHEEVKAEKTKQVARKEWWRWLLFLAAGVLMFEWYVYNKRVYL